MVTSWQAPPVPASGFVKVPNGKNVPIPLANVDVMRATKALTTCQSNDQRSDAGKHFSLRKLGWTPPYFRSYDQDYLDGSWSNSGRPGKVYKTSRPSSIWTENWVKCSRSSKRNKNRQSPERGIVIKRIFVKLGKLWSRGCTVLAACVILWETRCVMYAETCGSRFRDGKVRLHDVHIAEKRCVSHVHNGMALEQIFQSTSDGDAGCQGRGGKKWRTYENLQLGPSTVKPKDEVICKAQKEGRKVHWSHLQNTKRKDEKFTSLL